MFADRDLDEALGHLLGRARPCRSPRSISAASAANFARTTSRSSGSSPCGPNTFGKYAGLDPAEHHVGVGHRQRPAAAVAGRPRVGAGALRPDAQARAVEAAGSSRRRRPRCGCSSSARACARRPPGSRTRARTRRRSGTRRSRCRPCRSRSRVSKPASRAVRTMPTMPPAGPDRIASLPWKRCASVRPPLRLHEVAAHARHLGRDLRRRSGAGSATGRRRRPWCRRAAPASSAGSPRATR